MAIIGKFIKTDKGFNGGIATLALKGEISIEAIENKGSDKAPDYRVFHLYSGLAADIGAGWKKTSREGAAYISVSLDDPSFPQRIHCSLFKTGAEHGYELVWERPQPRKKPE